MAYGEQADKGKAMNTSTANAAQPNPHKPFTGVRNPGEHLYADQKKEQKAHMEQMRALDRQHPPSKGGRGRGR